MIRLKINSAWIISIALVYLSTVLLFAVFEIRNVRKELPEIITQFENMDTKLDVAGILETVNNVNDQIPSIVKEIKSTNQTLGDINTQMPAILSEVSALRQTTIPSVIKESQAIRASAPEMLDKADKVATKLSKIPEDMTKNMAKGAVKSAINAPSDIVKGVGKGVTDSVNLLKSKKAPVEEVIKEEIVE